MARYRVESNNGENTSYVPGWGIVYPARCNGALHDIAFVFSLGYGGSGFVHFGSDGHPYGLNLTKASVARLLKMRRDFAYGKVEDNG